MKLLIAFTSLFLSLLLPLGAQPRELAHAAGVTHPPLLVTSRSEIRLDLLPCSSALFMEDTLTVFNTGDEAIDLDIILPSGSLFEVIEPNPARMTLAPGEGKKIKVRYTPQGEEWISTSLEIQPVDFAWRDKLKRTVALFGSRSKTQLTPSVRSIQFDTVLHCESPKRKTFYLQNTGTTPVTISDPLSVTGPFSANMDSPLPITIQPGQFEPVEVTFKSYVTGTFSAYLYYKASPCDIRDSVLLQGAQVQPSYEFATANFGEVTVGGSGTTGAMLTNTNNRGIRIIRAQILPPTPGIEIDTTQFPIRVPPGQSRQIPLRFTPLTLGDIPDGARVWVHIDSLCDTTLTTTVTGTGIRGGISLNRSGFDFGDVIYCETAEDTVTLRNTGGAPVTLSTPVLGPPATGGFFTIVEGAAAPGTLAPGSTHRIIVRFIPGPGADARVDAVLSMTSSDPLRPQLEIPISGRRTSQSLRLDGAGFDPVIRGLSGTSTRLLVNTGTAPVPITALPIQAPFSVISTDPPLPATLAPGDTLVVEIRFAPPASGNYADSLRVTALTPCETFSFEITGVADELIPVTLRWGTASGKPGERVRIPLLLDNDATGADVTSFTASATFNGRILVPKSIVLAPTLPAGWTITSQQIAPSSVVFTASGPTPLGPPGELAYLEAFVALGDSVTTAITPGDSLDLHTPRASLEATPGLFTLEGYCDVGGGRLVRVDGNFGLKGVRPNPVRGKAEIEFETVEDGLVRVTLYDALGEEAARLLESSLPAGAYLLPLDASPLPSGVYYLEMRTATEIERTKVMIRR